MNKVYEEKSGTAYTETKTGWRTTRQPSDNYEVFGRTWHDSKRMTALGTPPAPTAWFVAAIAIFLKLLNSIS